ncbi:MAG: protein dithiol:quinone oxidoreductase, partial [Pseudomonadota bacterium]|nr:protein dithiol:quinone oxidoreductase [Pseudomonadota bacterium]
MCAADRPGQGQGVIILMFNKLVSIGRSQLYWVLLLVLSLLLEGVALYFQHILNEWPCVLCIQVRLLLLALITLSVVALLVWRFIRLHALMHFIAGCISVVMLDLSWN